MQLMARLPGTGAAGVHFGPNLIEVVWQKGRVVPGYDPNQVRRDAAGAWIRRQDYGTTGEYGWEIDHIMPVSKGGTDLSFNLQPLYWGNNRSKSDDWPTWKWAVSSP